MKVALIKPPSASGVLGLDMMVMVEPLGLECLAGAIEPDGHDCTIIDARIDGSLATRRCVEDACHLSCSTATSLTRSVF